MMSRYAAWRAAAVLVAALLLELACRVGLVPPVAVIPPSQMLVAAYDLLTSGALDPDIATSLGSVLVSILISIVGGTLLGAALYALPALRETLRPFLESYYAIPPIVFYPLLIMMFGLGNVPKIIIGVLFGLIAMAVNVMNGLTLVPPVMNKVGRTLRLGPWRTLIKIRIPAAAPSVYAGVKFAVAYSFIGVISSEFVMAAHGLGYQIAYDYDNFSNREMYGTIIVLLALVVVANFIIYAYTETMLARRRR